MRPRHPPGPAPIGLSTLPCPPLPHSSASPVPVLFWQSPGGGVWFGLVWLAPGLWPHRLKVSEGLRHGSAKKLYPWSYLSPGDYRPWGPPMPRFAHPGVIRSGFRSTDHSLATRLSNRWTNISVPLEGALGGAGGGGGGHDPCSPLLSAAGGAFWRLATYRCPRNVLEGGGRGAGAPPPPRVPLWPPPRAEQFEASILLALKASKQVFGCQPQTLDGGEKGGGGGGGGG